MAALGVPDNRVDEGEVIVTEREVRAQFDRPRERADRFVGLTPEHERPAHRPVDGRVALVGHEPLRRGSIRLLHARCAVVPVLEGILEMRERESRVGARERRIQTERRLEEVSGMLVVGLAVPVHVPQAAMVCAPRIQRAGRLQDGPMAFEGFDLAGDRRDNAIADLVEDHKGIVEYEVEDLGPDDPGATRFGQLDGHRQSCPPHACRAAHDVVDIQEATRLLCADASLVQREDRALRNHEQAAQLGQPGDHVMREGVGNATPSLRADERSTNGMTAMEARPRPAVSVPGSWGS